MNCNEPYVSSALFLEILYWGGKSELTLPVVGEI